MEFIRCTMLIGAFALPVLGNLNCQALAGAFPSPFEEYEPPAKKARPPGPPPEVKRASDLLERLGLKNQIDQLPDLINANLSADERRNRAADLPSAEALKPAVERAFAAKKVLLNVAIHMAKAVPAEDQAAALVFGEGPAGQRIASIYRQLATPKGMEDLKNFANAQTPEQATWASQIPFYTELGEATAQVKLAAALGAHASFTIAQGLLAAGAVPEANREIFKENFKTTYQELMQQNRLNTVVTLAFIAQTMPESEMQAWLDFAKSPSGARFYDGVIAGLEHAMGQAFKEYGPALVAAMKSAKKG